MVGVKGLAGGLKVEPLSDRPERLDPGARVFVEGEPVERTITGIESSRRVRVISLEGIDSREDAERLVGHYLEVAREALPDGSYYWHELIGLRVRDESGVELGIVEEVFRAGENEVYRVRGPGGDLLVPALRDVVRELDVERATMTVRLDVEEVG